MSTLVFLEGADDELSRQAVTLAESLGGDVRVTRQQNLILTGVPNDELEIGMPLQVVFERMSEEVAVPKWEPRT